MVALPKPSAAELESLLLGVPPAWTREDVAEAAGVSLEEARRLWRALGFADVGEAPAFTHADVDALGRLSQLVAEGVLDQATALQLVRAVGSTMARLAEWQVEVIADVVSRHAAAEPGSSRIATAYDVARRIVPEFEQLQTYAWRRNLAAAAMRIQRLGEVAVSADEGLLSPPMSVGFADLAGYTRLSRSLPHDALGDLVERFEQLAADRVAWHGARLVKSLGDSVLFVSTAARDAVDVGVSLVADLSEEPGMPQLRVGIATGTVLTRFGDVYGEAVNRASRLTAVAKRDRVVVDAATAEALGDAPGLVVRRLPPRTVRGLGRTACFRVGTR